MSKVVKGGKGGEIHLLEKGETANPNGRPPKVFSAVAKEMQAEGYERVSNANIVEAYEVMIGLDEDRIKEIVSDKAKPMLLRIIGKRLLGKDGFEIAEKVLDRAHGKAMQKQEISVPEGDKVQFVQIEVSGMTALLAQKGEEAKKKKQ